MEPYQSEDEQLEALKKWWKENGQSTVIGVVAAIVIVFGWRGWQDHQQGQSEAASQLYTSLLEADRLATESDKQRATASHLAEQLKTEFPGSGYAVMAALHSARYAVMNEQWSEAEQQLQWVLAEAETDDLKMMARYRLAKVRYQQGELDDALELTNELTDKGLAPAALELQGDIYQAMNRNEQALAAYRDALTKLEMMDKPVSNPLLEMKIVDLTAALENEAANSETAAVESAS